MESRLSQNRGLPFEQQKLGQTDQAPYTEPPNLSVNSRKPIPSHPRDLSSHRDHDHKGNIRLNHHPPTLSTHPHRSVPGSSMKHPNPSNSP